MMNSDTHTLPKDVFRDVWRAGFVVLGFFVFVALWAGYAPIAKTIRISGEISPRQPSRTVQHPSGGRIETVHVALYDRVKKGDLLLTLDQSELLLTQSALTERAILLSEELDEIEQRLVTGTQTVPSDSRFSAITRMYQERDRSFTARLTTGRSRLKAAHENLKLLISSKAILENRHRNTTERLEKSQSLAKKGHVTQTQVEQLQEAVLQINVEISRQNLEIEAIKADIAAAETENDLIRSEHMTSLAEQKSTNQRELISIESELDRIAYVLSESKIRAPADGMITSLPFVAAGMVARPSDTLAVISLPLEDPEIELWIPARHIDQVSPDQDGQLTITSLPARDAPLLTARVLSVAEEPVKDRDGKVIHYLARASISADDVVAARNRMKDRFQLVQGMPISVALSVDSVTLGEFLIQPLWSIWKKAFEE